MKGSELDADGVAFTWAYLPASKHAPARVRVSVPAPSGGAFTIIAQWDRFIALEPQHAEAHLERAGTYSYKRDRPRFLADLERAGQLGSQEACDLRRRH